MPSLRLPTWSAVLCCLLPLSLAAVDAENTRMLASPAHGGDRIVFAYDRDLWLVGRNGGSARRLTQAAGQERDPAVSPDGRWLAFSADYNGNVDVYLMPLDGGEARRLTWHPGEDIVRGFTPDSRAVLFESARSVHTQAHSHLYTVPIEGGAPTRLPIPHGSKAALSPDGTRIAYTPIADRHTQWKNYRGGTQSRIWIMNLSDYGITEVPKPTTGANDSDPQWIGDALIFASDRAGEINLHRFQDGRVEQLTHFDDFPVVSPSAHADGSVVFEQAGFLYRLDAGAEAPTQIRISARSDLAETRERFAAGAKWVRSAAPSPDLKRVALEFRGEIITVPADKGDPRNLSRSPGAHDRSPVWSPDGSKLAWFSDLHGEYELFLASQDGRGTPRRYALEGAGFYDQPVFSPDGKWIAFRDNSQSLWAINLDSGRSTKVASEPVYSPLNPMSASWSPDSRWLAYTVQNAGLIQTVYVWSVERDVSLQISDGLSEMVEPVFDANGEHLYVLASTDAGPLKDWFSQISVDASLRHALFAVTLRKDGPHPVPPQSDEVKTATDAADQKEDQKDAKDKGADAKKPAGKTPNVRIDIEGIQDRIVALPVGTGTRRLLRAGASGEIFYVEATDPGAGGRFDGSGALKRFQLSKRESKTLASDVQAFALSSDGKRILYQQGENWMVTEVADKLPGGKGRLRLDAIQVRVDPRAEWAQILDEAWRINRDYFYASNFHGADWPQMREKYRQFLPHLTSRSDLDRVIVAMLSELAVGHSYHRTGEQPGRPATIKVGLLGADYVIDKGRWRFDKVYGGLNWDPDLRAPLRAPGIDVRAGEYLLAVDGVELTAAVSVYSAFEHREGRQVQIRVGPSADGKGARELTVVPIASEAGLRYRDWVEGNLRTVTERTGGRVAYVHVPDTGDGGHASFKRYFYPQSHREAIILDERHNGGGLIADYYIDVLRRPFIARWVMRYGDELVSPRGAIFGPKVMLADETAGSGGDLLPWMFQRFELGPVIGKTTWGGLVGILGFPLLMDGGRVTAPNLAILTEDGYTIENTGVAPDIEVEQWPAEVNAGRDPQLEKAIEQAMEALQQSPPKPRTRPEFPQRARRLP